MVHLDFVWDIESLMMSRKEPYQAQNGFQLWIAKVVIDKLKFMLKIKKTQHYRKVVDFDFPDYTLSDNGIHAQ